MIQKSKAYNEAFARLNKKQREAVEQIDGPVMVVAGPGTGKTELLTTRIGYLLQNTDTGADNILCLTYTDTAAVEMRKRLIRYIGPLAHRINIQTFHAFCNGVILEHPDEFGIHGLELASDIDKIEILQEILLKLDPKNPMKAGSRDLYSSANMLKRLFEDMKKESMNPKELIRITKEEIETSDLKKDKLSRKLKFIAAVELYDIYRERMIAKKRYDFDDMILWVIRAFNSSEDLLRNYQEKFQYILVDEFQDTSGSQFEILNLLCNYWDDPNLFVVGDDDQSIYRFQGANIENIQLFYEKFKDSLKVIVLEENYRSSQNILNLSKSLISNNIRRLGNSLDGVSFDKNLLASNPAVADADIVPKILTCKNPQQEAIYIVRQIEKLLSTDKVPPSEIAVLYPKNALADNVRELLEARNIPYQISLNTNILESKLVESLLLIANYVSQERKTPFRNDHLLFSILNMPYFDIDPLVVAELQHKLRYTDKFKKKYFSLRQLISEADQFVENNLFSSITNNNYHNLLRLSQNIEKWIQLVDNEIISRIFDNFLYSGILTYVSQQKKHIEMLEDLDSFFTFIKNESEKAPYITLDQFIEKVNLFKRLRFKILRSNTIGSSKGVILSTVHSSKGKEFEHVFMLGCIKKHWEKKWGGWGFSFPEKLIRSSDGDDQEEKRRLFYVGITRCKSNLVLTLPETIEDVVENQSIFISELAESVYSLSDSVEITPQEQLPYILDKHSKNEEVTVPLIDRPLIKARVDRYSLSVSHLNKFLECPLSFYFEYIVGVPMIENSAIVFGSVAHHALEYFFKSMKGSAIPAKEVLLHLFEEEMFRKRGSFHGKDFEQRMISGKEALSKYYEERRSQWSSEVKIEMRCKDILVDDCKINGKIDKVEIDGNNVVLIDYKTGNYKNNVDKYKVFNRPGQRVRKDTKHHVENFGGNLWRQAVFYKLLIMNDPKLNWTVQHVNFDFIEADKFGNIPEPHSVVISNDDLEMVKTQIKSVYNQIKNFEFNRGCGSEDCKWCNHAKEKYEKGEKVAVDI
ncbi:MAG: ATP-dependent helicase [Chitinophagales bacterium]|nr:ATP-dependent helicase [Chitinophagales bacterium]